jgi:hypothetical protein
VDEYLMGEISRCGAGCEKEACERKNLNKVKTTAQPIYKRQECGFVCLFVFNSFPIVNWREKLRVKLLNGRRDV